jgi:hypothetical protein
MWGQHVEIDSDEDEERIPLNVLAHDWSPMKNYVILPSKKSSGFSALIQQRRPRVEDFAPAPARYVGQTHHRPRMTAPVSEPLRDHDMFPPNAQETQRSCDDVLNSYCGACFNMFKL